MSLAIDELVTYLNDLSEMNTLEASQLKVAIDSQYKEIKQVMTGHTINPDSLEDDDVDIIREQIALNSDLALARTASKKYMYSSQIIPLVSDFEEMTDFWQEQMEEQKHSAAQSEIAADQLKLEAGIVQSFFLDRKIDLQEKFS